MNIFVSPIFILLSCSVISIILVFIFRKSTTYELLGSVMIPIKKTLKKRLLMKIKKV